MACWGYGRVSQGAPFKNAVRYDNYVFIFQFSKRRILWSTHGCTQNGRDVSANSLVFERASCVETRFATCLCHMSWWFISRSRRNHAFTLVKQQFLQSRVCVLFVCDITYMSFSFSFLWFSCWPSRGFHGCTQKWCFYLSKTACAFRIGVYITKQSFLSLFSLI